MVIKAIYRAVEAAGARVGKDVGVRTKNLAVEAALELLDSPPSKVRNLGHPRLGGLPKRYTDSIPSWDESDKKSDQYYRIAIRDNKHIELTGPYDGDYRLPDRRYRDPSDKEAEALINKYPGKIVEMLLKNCRSNCRYGLWYRVGKTDESTPSKEIKKTIEEKSDYSKLIKFSCKRESLPRQIRDCQPTVEEYAEELDAEKKYKKEKQLSEDATTDWLTIETSTKPLLEEIQDEFPDLSALSFEDERRLVKVLHRGIEIGMMTEEFVDIARDLSKPRITGKGKKTRKEWLTPNGFVQAVNMIVTLTHVKKLHLKNLKETGVGILEDFVGFVDTTIRNIRTRRLSFEGLSEFDKHRGCRGGYLQHSNVFYLPDIQTILADTMVHEASHSYDDSIKLRESRAKSEMRAAARGIKAGLLVGSLGWRRELEIWARNKSKLMQCLGTSAEVVSWETPRKIRARFQKMKYGYKRELLGESWPSAHLEAGDRAANFAIWSTLYTNLKSQSESLGHLYNKGKKGAVEMMLASAASTFHTQISRMSDKRLSKKMNAREIYELFKPWAVIQSAILYLDPASLPRFNEIMERRHIPFIVDQYWKLPAEYDGV